MNTTMIILIAVGTFLLGVIACFLICRFAQNGLFKKALQEAEIIKKNKIVEAKEKFIALKAEHENMVRQQEQKRQQADQRLQQREDEIEAMNVSLEEKNRLLMQ